MMEIHTLFILIPLFIILYSTPLRFTSHRDIMSASKISSTVLSAGCLELMSDPTSPAAWVLSNWLTSNMEPGHAQILFCTGNKLLDLQCKTIENQHPRRRLILTHDSKKKKSNEIGCTYNCVCVGVSFIHVK